jgi:hypothetical protein
MTRRVHEREAAVTAAKIKLQELLIAWAESPEVHELTGPEYVQVLTDQLSNRVLSWAKYEIRFERHGNYDDPGGLE